MFDDYVTKSYWAPVTKNPTLKPERTNSFLSFYSTSYKSVLEAVRNIYGGAFLAKIICGLKPLTIFGKKFHRRCGWLLKTVLLHLNNQAPAILSRLECIWMPKHTI